METQQPTRQAPRSGAPRRGFGILGRLLVVAVVVAVGSTAAWLLTRASSPQPGLTAHDIPAMQVKPADVRPGSRAPRVAHVADVRPATKARPERDPRPHAEANGADPMASWARQAAAATGIPRRALWAYGHAEVVMRSAAPECHLSWATLAGIGRVESNHGRYQGAHLLPNGDVSRPIIGVPLDGAGDVAAVADTDGGALDGDPVRDRAVGPMQFIPSTWRNYAADGNGDGKGDPENIDDAALAAGHYLCAGGRDMATAAGWWSGLTSYNNSVVYGQKVFGLADRYAHAAARVLSSGG